MCVRPQVSAFGAVHKDCRIWLASVRCTWQRTSSSCRAGCRLSRSSNTWQPCVVHEMPCHHNLDEYVHAYLQTAALEDDRKDYLFRSGKGRSGELSYRSMSQSEVYRMISRRAEAADVATNIGWHSFRATGIAEFLRNGWRLEVAQQMANHESSRTTRLNDRRLDEVTLDERERI